MTRILLGHGGGGSLMQELIAREFAALYSDPALLGDDAARLALPQGPLAFCSDGYVVQPLEFAGGDIGRLAVVGTANDLAMVGARPLHLSVSLILEEGLPLDLLRRLVASMAAARTAGAAALFMALNAAASLASAFGCWGSASAAFSSGQRWRRSMRAYRPWVR